MAQRKPRAQHKDLKVKRGAHGLGLFATADIPKGTFLIEYWGRIVTEDEANRIGGKYLFELEGEKAIVGTTRKNIARYINHSCTANCEPEEDRGRIFITSTRRIRAGEELGYDYGKEYWHEHIKPLGCRCGCGGKGRKNFR